MVLCVIFKPVTHLPNLHIFLKDLKHLVRVLRDLLQFILGHIAIVIEVTQHPHILIPLYDIKLGIQPLGLF